MPIGLLGTKVGMMQVYSADGRAVPVTVIAAGPCPVVQRKRTAGDGYDAIQIGYWPVKVKRVTKPLQGHFAKHQVAPTRYLREIRVTPDAPYEPGQTLTVTLFSEGDTVEVTGVSKGKGFQGGVKRWHYRGGPASHGSMFYRAPGSIGASSFPSRVFKGHHMPGRMGGDRVTVKGLRVVKVLVEKHLLLVSGAVPGPRGGLVAVSKAG
ncbi:MAG: 50S ribosomal protein L3 [candidate division NC10 bacterium]|nr:50S ribosomal protein L3 [candidate division NC10 bacterium]